MKKLKQFFCNHKTELAYTEPIVKTLSDGRKTSKRKWIDHIVCVKCDKKWHPATKEEIIEQIKKLKTNI